MLYCKEEKEQIKPKVSRREEIQLREEINKWNRLEKQ